MALIRVITVYIRFFLKCLLTLHSHFQVKQSLKEAVDMNEQQLQMTEQKDQEFVKLKLDIQQTIADKDKTIKEQKQKLKGMLGY